METVQRKRLDELLSLLLAVVEQTSLTGARAGTIVEQRIHEAIKLSTGKRAVVDRITHAPRRYLLAQDAVGIARQSALLEPVPERGRARVGVESLGNGRWLVEVASRDRPGLLARVTGVLSDHGIDVIDAIVATWGDGAAIESFIVLRPSLDPPRLGMDAVRSASPPDPDALAESISIAFSQPLSSPPNPDAVVVFDDAGSPWYTLCEVRSPDRRGLLHMITVGLADAGASVHSARLVTIDGQAVDQFHHGY